MLLPVAIGLNDPAHIKTKLRTYYTQIVLDIKITERGSIDKMSSGNTVQMLEAYLWYLLKNNESLLPGLNPAPLGFLSNFDSTRIQLQRGAVFYHRMVQQLCQSKTCFPTPTQLISPSSYQPGLPETNQHFI